MAKSEFLITAGLRYVTGKAGTHGSTGLRYLHLHTVSPTIAGTGGTAVTGGGYVPVSVGASFPTVSTGALSVSNTSIIQYTTATTAAWGTVVAASMHLTTSTSSSMLWVSNLDNSVTVSSGTNVKLAVGAVVISDK